MENSEAPTICQNPTCGKALPPTPEYYKKHYLAPPTFVRFCSQSCALAALREANRRAGLIMDTKPSPVLLPKKPIGPKWPVPDLTKPVTINVPAFVKVPAKPKAVKEIYVPPKPKEPRVSHEPRQKGLCFCCKVQMSFTPSSNKTQLNCDCTPFGAASRFCTNCNKCLAHCSCGPGQKPFRVGEGRQPVNAREIANARQDANAIVEAFSATNPYLARVISFRELRVATSLLQALAALEAAREDLAVFEALVGDKWREAVK